VTFDTDFCRFVFKDGSRLDFMCKELMVEWPPPEYMCLAGRNFQRVRYSLIKDNDPRLRSITARGAEYRHMPNVVLIGENDAKVPEH
jgi:hypothetical protein